MRAMDDHVATLLYCRPGFERECAQEVTDAAAALGIEGHVKTRENGGYALFLPHQPVAGRLRRGLRFSEFIFVRQMVSEATLVDGLPTGDRITPLLDAIRSHFGGGFSTLWLETPDTGEAKELAGFLRRFAPALKSAVAKAGLLGGGPAAPRLHLCFLSSAAVYLGASDIGNSAPWPMGIPRLKLPREAPSRSTLKLAEAFLVFLDAADRAEWLREGRTAVDLGAAPGGWTWQLVRHGLHVTAVDNGALDPALLSCGQVEHIRADGFHWTPRARAGRADWLVCDMVEKPSRIAALVADWIGEGRATRALFNLKLPMKRRRFEVEHCRELIHRRLEASAACAEYSLRFRQLFHDREEVTGYLAPAV